MKRIAIMTSAAVLVLALVLSLSGAALAGPLAILNTISVTSGSPWGATVNTTTNKAYITGYGGKVWVVDGTTDALITTITVGANGTALGIAANPNTNKIYVGQFLSATVAVIDGSTDTMTGSIPIGGVMPQPTGVAVNPVTNRVYVTKQGGSSLAVIDGATDTMLTTVPGLGTCAWGVAVNTATNEIYVTDNPGVGVTNVYVIDGNTNTVTHTIPMACRMGFISVNPITNKAYASQFIPSGGLVVLDGATHTVSTTIGGFTSPYGVAVDSTLNKVLVSDYSASQFRLVDGATDTIASSIAVGSAPWGMGCNPGNTKAYVPNSSGQSISVVQYNNPQVTISSSASPGGGGTTSGDGTYYVGDAVNMHASANAGYHFINWTEGGVPQSSNADYSFTAAANRTLVANFALNQYTISSSADPVAGGTTSGAGTYNHGDTVNMHAGANAGYHFINWTEGGSQVSTSPDYSFTATANRTLVANFGFQVTLHNSDGGGTVSGGGIFKAGSSVTVHGTPLYGTHFSSWWDPAVGTVSFDADYTFTATVDRDLYGSFCYHIDATANPIGGGTALGDQPEYGHPATVHAMPFPGYHFLDWTEGGSVVSTSANYSFTPSGDRSLVANFATTPTVTTTAPSGVTMTGATSGGDVTSDGGDPVTARGVCWSTSHNPTTADDHTTDGSGTGLFTSTISGCAPGTPYYVRAYATNPGGTSYGSEQSFTTHAYDLTLLPGSDAKSADPGAQATYSLTLKNTGNTTDTFDSEITGNAWNTVASPSSATVDAGESTTITVTVDIPAGAVGGATDSAFVEFTSQGDPTKDATSVVTTTANNVYGVAVSPHTDSTWSSPGFSAHYTLDVTNNGNTSDTFDVSVIGNAWNTYTDKPTVTLGSGESTQVSVTVEVPAGAVGGNTDTATVTYTSAGDLSKSDSDVVTTNVNFAPSVTSIAPASGVNDGTVHITDLRGDHFGSLFKLPWYGVPISTPTVRLEMAGQADITATNVVVSHTSGTALGTAAGNKITCDFDLKGARPGAWTVCVENADGQCGELAGGFTVVAVKPTVSGVSPSTGEPGSRVTVTGSNFGPAQGGSTITIGGVEATVVSWSDSKIVVVVPDGAASGAVVVTTASGGSNTNKDFTVVYPTWYLAEGTTAWGFNTYITIENPNDSAVTARITYMDPAASSGMGRVFPPRDIRLPARSQTTIDPRWDLGATDFCTRVTCLDGKTIGVDRTMFWTGDGAASPEAHSSVGTTMPSTAWFLPEGCSEFGFETWTLVENPGSTTANIDLTYMTEAAGPRTLQKTVAPYSRATFSMEADIGKASASIEVASDTPVIAERSMYRNDRREGSCSVGTNAAAIDFYLAEGSTAWGFTTYLLIQNPNDAPADVTVFYLTPSGPVQKDPFRMEANSRKTIRVNDVEGVTNTDTSIQVFSPQGIIAERAMYWDSGKGEAMHDSIGLSAPHRSFMLPDGQTSGGWQTYTLVQNPNETDVDIRVTYLPQGGGEAVSFTDSLPANTRRTYDMSDRIESGRASVLVEVTDPGCGVMVERSMYCNDRGVGTDTIGCWND